MGKDRQERLGQGRGHDNEDGFYSKCSGKPTGEFRQVLQSLQSVDDILTPAYFRMSCRWGGFQFSFCMGVGAFILKAVLPLMWWCVA